MVDRNCVVCGNTFRVSEGTIQDYCNSLCKAKVVGNASWVKTDRKLEAKKCHPNQKKMMNILKKRKQLEKGPTEKIISKNVEKKQDVTITKTKKVLLRKDEKNMIEKQNEKENKITGIEIEKKSCSTNEIIIPETKKKSETQLIETESNVNQLELSSLQSGNLKMERLAEMNTVDELVSVLHSSTKKLANSTGDNINAFELASLAQSGNSIRSLLKLKLDVYKELNK